jgi:hypothetical protein
MKVFGGKLGEELVVIRQVFFGWQLLRQFLAETACAYEYKYAEAAYQPSLPKFLCFHCVVEAALIFALADFVNVQSHGSTSPQWQPVAPGAYFLRLNSSMIHWSPFAFC